MWGNSSGTGNGVSGSAQSGVGVGGSAQSGTGVKGESQSGNGVLGSTNATGFAAAISGVALNPNGIAPGMYGESKGKGPAGYFMGNVIVTGDIQLANADCAEDFEIAGLQKVEPGTVMVIDSEGKLRQSEQGVHPSLASLNLRTVH